MMKPKRIQRSRKKGWRKPEGAIIVDRTSRWGNPFKVGEVFNVPLILALMGFKDEIGTGLLVEDNAHAVELYKKFIMTFEAKKRKSMFLSLAGRDLVCFCSLDKPCHADVLLKLSNP